jgi:subtilisin-like proprotein convertase family protein
MKQPKLIGALLLGCLAHLTLYGAPLGAQVTVELTNPDPIKINTSRVPGNDGRARAARATPYPSAIEVSGFLASETIEKVTVTLHELFHEVPDDIDILLVGPTGLSIVILSDAGGGNAIDPQSPVTLTLDDDAERPVPDDDPLAPGRFQPSNHELEEDDDADVFPEPVDGNGAPAGPAPEASPATRLSVFAGSHPNGQWRLYVVDDDVLDAGRIGGGWSLTIRTAAQAPPFRRGDSNQDAAINLTDAVWTLSALFLGGAQPACADAADADDDGSVNIADAVYTLNHLFRGGPEPPAPGPAACGSDPTGDDLPCLPPPQCVSDCALGLVRCDGRCTDPSSDPNNCGNCGVICPPDMACLNGVCVSGG